jgi:hypothetical protein
MPIGDTLVEPQKDDTLPELTSIVGTRLQPAERAQLELLARRRPIATS